MNFKHTAIIYNIVLILLMSTYPLYSLSDNNEKILTVALRKQPYSIDFKNAFSSTDLLALSSIYSGLLTLNPSTLQVDVGLAISWFVNQDNTEYVFNLRRNLQFSDSTKITAQDVKASWLASIKSKNIYLSLFESIVGVSEYDQGTGGIENIGIKVLSDHSLKVTLTHSVPYFLQLIVHPAFSITSSEQAQQKDWDSNPVSVVQSGPLVIESQTDDLLVLKKNEFFWGAEYVSLDYAHLKFYDSEEAHTVIDEINNGEVQWSTFYAENTAKLDDKDWVLARPLFGSAYLFYPNTEIAPWNNADVRTAIKLLLPIEDMQKEYLFPANSLVPSIDGVYEAKIEQSTQNIEMALELLDKNGYPKGKGLGKIILFAEQYNDGAYNALFDTILETLQSTLDTPIVIETMPHPEYYNNFYTVNASIGMFSWIGDFLDPAAFLHMWNRPSPSLGHNYNDSVYQELFEQSHNKQSKEREAILISAEQYLLSQSVVMPLYHLYSVNIVRTDLLKGWEENLLDWNILGSIHFIEPSAIPNLSLRP